MFDNFTVPVVIIDLNNLLEVLSRSQHRAVIGDISGVVSGVVSGDISVVVIGDISSIVQGSNRNSGNAIDEGKDRGRLLHHVVARTELLLRRGV